MTTRLILVAILLMGETHRAAVAADDQATPPSVEEIIRNLKAKEDAIETLQVRCVCLDGRTLLKPGTKRDLKFPVADNVISMNGKSQIAWEVTREGAACMTANIQLTNTRDDGTTFDARETVISHCEDGASGRYLKTNRQINGVDQPDIGASTMGYLRTHVPPFNLTTRHFGKPISRLLSESNAKFIAIEHWDNRPVIVVEGAPKAVRDDRILRQRFWIDADRGVAVRRQSFVQRGEDKPWGLEYQLDARKYSEAAPGVWLPGTADTLNWDVTEMGQDFLMHKERYVLTDWIVNEKIDPSHFDADLPALAPDTPRPTPER